MTGTDQQHTSPPEQGGEDVRVIRRPGASRRGALLYLLFALLAVAASLAYLLGTRGISGDAPPRVAPDLTAPDVVPKAQPVMPRTERLRRAASVRRVAPPPADFHDEEPFDVPSSDPDDIASYFEPGDPEPTAAELIEALHHAGIRSGIGAFNPPGTSPLLDGLVVPEDYDLPEGYVRHHQVTDEGEPLEPILLFSPDYDFYDADGQPIPIPENRVVPPEFAPPDLPSPPPPPPSS